MITKFKTGDKIFTKSKSSEHIVDSVDFYDNVTLVFTDDKKYFPIEDVIKIDPNITDEDAIDMIFGLTIEERDRLFLSCFGLE
jgi:hypothetical protein